MKKYLLLILLALLNCFVAVAQEPYAVFNNGTLTFYYDSERTGRQGTAYDLNSGNNFPEWSINQNVGPNIAKVVFHTSFADARPVSTYGWFMVLNTSSLATIEGIENLNTSCVTTMAGMFYGCSQLTTLDLSRFDTRNVTSMEGLFGKCSGLTTLDLSRFDTRNVTDMSNMFNGCSHLTTIYCGDNWNTNKVKVNDSSNMFQYCEKLVGGKGTGFNSDYTDKTYARIDGGSTNPGYLTDFDAYAHFQNGTLTFYYDRKKHERQGTVYDLNSDDFAKWTLDQNIGSNTISITKVVFDTSFADARPVSTFGWFMVDVDNGKTSVLTTIEGIENLNTSCVTTMEGMFYGCTQLTTLDLSHFDTRNVTNMGQMFSECSNLTTIYCGHNWTTDKVNDDYNMFYGCTSLVGGAGTGYDFNHRDAAYAHIDEGASNPGYLTAADAYTHFLNGTLTFYYDGKKNERQGQGTVFALNSGDNNPAWINDVNIYPNITKVVFDTTFADARPVSTFGWFGGSSSLTTIEGIENLNTSFVTSMAYMFYGCSGLTTLDLSRFDTRNVTNMALMFKGCSQLTTLDLSHFDTSDVTMMTGMFYGCTQLTTLDLSHFDTRNVTNMYMMFADCSHLTTIYCGDKWNTDKVEISENMFLSCDELVGGAGTGLNSDYMDKTYARIDEGESNPGYLTGPDAYAHFLNGTFTFYYDGQKNERQGQGTVFALNSGYDNPDWINDANIYPNITKVVFDTTFADARPVSTFGWFGGSSSLTTIEGIENLNTSCVTNMALMFKGCTQLTKLDLSHFDTSNVTMMNGMFYDCSGLTKLDLSHFDTRNVTNMYMMFANCSHLKTIYCGDKWNTDKVENSENMFLSCDELVGGAGTGLNSDFMDKTYARIDEGESNPGYLTGPDAYAHFLNGTFTFYYDGQKNERQGTVYNLNSGDDNPAWINDANIYPNITKVVFDTTFADARPVSTFAWFINAENTSSLTTIEGIENLNTSCVTNMAGMFYGCSQLTTLDLSHFDTRNVTNMNSMFLGCTGLTTLDLSHFDTSNVTIMDWMFNGCSNLATIYCSDNWNTDNVVSSSYMFFGCSNLVGGAGTEYNSNYTDKAYARIDEGASNPGYLTLGNAEVVLNETDSDVPEATTGDVIILVKRTIKANEWSTICLPFNLTEARTKAAFGEGVQLKEFRNYEVEYDTNSNVVGLTVNFDDIDLSEGFNANHPYLIRVENDIDEFTVTSTINPDESNCFIEYDNDETSGTFKGTFHAQTTVPNNCLFLSGNKFWYSAGQTKMKAFRAYFEFNDVLADVDNASARISMSFDDETTRIEDVNLNNNDNDSYYDLQGRRVARPQKGLYIKNNKKVVVK